MGVSSTAAVAGFLKVIRERWRRVRPASGYDTRRVQQMKRLAYTTAALLALALMILDGGLRTDGRCVIAAVAGENDYFESLTRRADAWKAYSLLGAPRRKWPTTTLGGFAQGPSSDDTGVTSTPGDRHAPEPSGRRQGRDPGCSSTTPRSLGRWPPTRPR